MTFEGLRYYLIFLLFVLCSSSVADFLNHSKTFTISSDTETRETSTYQYTGTWNGTSSGTPPDSRSDQFSTSNLSRTELWNSKLKSAARDAFEDFKKFVRNQRTTVKWNITNETISLLKTFGDMISETPPPGYGGRNVEYIFAVVAMEIFTMASGNHFILPPIGDEKIEKRLRKNARGFGSIWLDLCYVEDLEIILRAAIVKTISLTHGHDQVSFLQNRVTIDNMQEYLLSVLNETFDAIDDRDDSLANDFFKYRKSFANKGVTYYISFDNLTLGIIDERNVVEWLKSLEIRKILIHHHFRVMRKKNPVVHLFYEMACKDSKLKIELNEIYSNILDKIAKRFIIIDKYPHEEIIQNLIEELISAIKAHELLRRAYENANINYEKAMDYDTINRDNY